MITIFLKLKCLFYAIVFSLPLDMVMTYELTGYNSLFWESL
uniref:Uncharacterized protein n=1 Tax=Rhizophora mucronata TaxID=61149 RepID=A0A2P2J190_RHIMU